MFLNQFIIPWDYEDDEWVSQSSLSARIIDSPGESREQAFCHCHNVSIGRMGLIGKVSFVFTTFVILLSLISPAMAETRQKQIKQTALDAKETESAEVLANRFELTSDDWIKYQEIMAGEGRFHWQTVDPVWVLSIYAESESERRRFAKLAARQEYERTRKFLMFKDAYVEAFWKMYGHEPVMDVAALEQRYEQRKLDASVSSSGTELPLIKQQDHGEDRLVLFMTTDNCDSCNQLFIQLSQYQLDVPGAGLDIHFVGDTKQKITGWAKQMGIEPSDISNGFITLNQNADMYESYGNPVLPAAYYYDASSNSVKPIEIKP
jgi:integrating conjugative element protein (TIGR03759 family)